MTTDRRDVRVIDGVLLALLLVAAASMIHGLFVNQTAFYAAFFLLVVRSIVAKQNAFFRLDVEPALIAFFLAAVVSAALSDHTGDAFRHLVKRVVLVPYLYVAASVAALRKENVERIASALLVVAGLFALYYVVEGVLRWQDGWYRRHHRGPEVLTHHITVGQMFAFVALAALSIAWLERRGVWRRALFGSIGALSLLAVVVSYSRSAWIGFVAGAFAVALVERKWWAIAPIPVAALMYILLIPDRSAVIEYRRVGDQWLVERQTPTFDKANDCVRFGDRLLVADYAGGVLEYRDGEVLPFIETPSPALKLIPWNDDRFVVMTLDNRFLLYAPRADSFVFEREFWSPGKTRDAAAHRDYFYAVDRDSGVTVWRDPADPKIVSRVPLLDFGAVVPDSSRTLVYSRHRGLVVLRAENGATKSDTLAVLPPDEVSRPFLGLGCSALLNGFRLFDYADGAVHPLTVSRRELRDLWLVDYDEDTVVGFFFSGEGFEATLDDDSVRVLAAVSAPLLPMGFEKSGERAWAVYWRSNRLLSLFDFATRSNQERLTLWSIGARIIADNPVFGVGDVDLHPYFFAYREPHQKEAYGHLHNNYLHLLATLGVVGLLAYLWLIGSLAVVHLRAVRLAERGTFDRAFAVGALGAFVAYLASGVGNWNFGDHEVVAFVWFFAGLAASVVKRRRDAGAELSLSD
ncbi:MAG: hypothetical protein GF419_08430 [Ignavibacteriales bacterium]|nr:hypothetical protein [Ignavibacteriales bacterium]